MSVEQILASPVLVNACAEVCPGLLAWLETLDLSEMEFVSQAVPPCTGKPRYPSAFQWDIYSGNHLAGFTQLRGQNSLCFEGQRWKRSEG